MMDRLHKAFRRGENQLISVLERRKGEVEVNREIHFVIQFHRVKTTVGFQRSTL